MVMPGEEGAGCGAVCAIAPVAMSVAIAVVANVLSAGWYKRVDVTKTERYTLSQGSARLVAGMASPMQVDAYVTRGLAQLDAFTRDLTDLLKEYERASGGKFKFTLIEAKSDEQKEQAKEAGLQEVPFGQLPQLSVREE